MEKEFSKYKEKGLTGLANLGNTCFMNSALQCLAHTQLLNNFLDNKDYKKKLNRKPESLILVEWDNLREMMWSENCVISPGGFLAALQKVARIKDKAIFNGFAQNDLPEFLGFIIDCFHTAISREVLMNIKGEAQNKTDKLASKCFTMMKNMYKKEYSEFLTMFFGISISQISSLEGKLYGTTPEPFFMLDAPIPQIKAPTLASCIKLYAENEKLDESNKYYNEKTKQHEIAYKKMNFFSLPNVLIINLKRFSNNMRKNKVYVDFPLEDFDVSSFIQGYNKRSYVYDLYAICQHSGNVLGGHYTACVKNYDDKWYLFNDTSVSKIPIDKLKNNKAYCFFYRKKKPTK
jgi:ubiquitin carboxyl-terminal hydrolase 8